MRSVRGVSNTGKWREGREGEEGKVEWCPENLSIIQLKFLVAPLGLYIIDLGQMDDPDYYGRTMGVFRGFRVQTPPINPFLLPKMHKIRPKSMQPRNPNPR